MWIPLESNPEVMTKFLHTLGVPKKWSIIDVYGLDPDLLAIVPRPVLAVILLYPTKTEKTIEEKEESKDNKNDSVYYIKQYIHNACGTIALLHSVANNLDVIKLEEGSLKQFLDETMGLSSAERGKWLENTQGIASIHKEFALEGQTGLEEGSLKQFLDETMGLSSAERGKWLENTQGIASIHKEFALEGQTGAPDEDVEVYHHFIAFIHKDGKLYELDGRKHGPISHGSTTPDDLLTDAARVCKEYMKRDPSEVRFTVVALAASE